MSFAEAWTNLLDTPRAINRFGAQLRLVLPLHQSGEVDLVDLILLTLIRLHAPKVFEAIRSRKDLLTGERSSETKFDWEGVIGDRVTSNSVTAVQEVVESLFPATSVRPDHKTPGPRVANAEYFDRYFVQGIPDHDVADYAVQRAIDEANKGNSDALHSLLKGAKSDKQRAAMINKLQKFSKWGEDSSTTPVGALKVVLGELHLLTKRSESIFPSVHQTARSWVGEMLIRLPSDVTANEVTGALADYSEAPERSLLLESVAHASGIRLPAGVIVAAVKIPLRSADSCGRPSLNCYPRVWKLPRLPERR